MSRLYTLGTWSFSSLAIALALLVPLTVPEGAFADASSGSPDVFDCGCAGTSDPDWGSCEGDACAAPTCGDPDWSCPLIGT